MIFFYTPEGDPLWSIFSELERLELKILEPEPLFKNFGCGSWSQRNLFNNCGAVAGKTRLPNSGSLIQVHIWKNSKVRKKFSLDIVQISMSKTWLMYFEGNFEFLGKIISTCDIPRVCIRSKCLSTLTSCVCYLSLLCVVCFAEYAIGLINTIITFVLSINRE